MIQAETAFIVIKSQDGTYTAITDLKAELEVARPASELDVKRASRELAEAVQLKDIARIVASVMTQSPPDDTSKVANAVRQSLLEKGLLQ
jgi:hypothetical protein